jgi:hypothetical protein
VIVEAPAEIAAVRSPAGASPSPRTWPWPGALLLAPVLLVGATAFWSGGFFPTSRRSRRSARWRRGRSRRVAEALGEPLTTVEGRLYRGLRKLRGEMEA